MGRSNSTLVIFLQVNNLDQPLKANTKNNVWKDLYIVTFFKTKTDFFPVNIFNIYLASVFFLRPLPLFSLPANLYLRLASFLNLPTISSGDWDVMPSTNRFFEKKASTAIYRMFNGAIAEILSIITLT